MEEEYDKRRKKLLGLKIGPIEIAIHKAKKREKFNKGFKNKYIKRIEK